MVCFGGSLWSGYSILGRSTSISMCEAPEPLNLAEKELRNLVWKVKMRKSENKEHQNGAIILFHGTRKRNWFAER